VTAIQGANSFDLPVYLKEGSIIKSKKVIEKEGASQEKKKLKLVEMQLA
jgi:hypothetical protein